MNAVRQVEVRKRWARARVNEFGLSKADMAALASTPEQRKTFWASLTPNGDCLEKGGPVGFSGGVYHKVFGVKVIAQRFAWLTMRGMPPATEPRISPACKNPRCCNLKHLKCR